MGEASLPLLNDSSSNFLPESDDFGDSFSEDDSQESCQESEWESDDETDEKTDFQLNTELQPIPADAMTNKFAVLNCVNDE